MGTPRIAIRQSIGWSIAVLLQAILFSILSAELAWR
jgi:hypothetical protein